MHLHLGQWFANSKTPLGLPICCSKTAYAPALAANNDSWGWTFTKSFFSGLIQGVRQSGQSFTEYVNQNVSDTTFGTVDPKKLFIQGLNMVEETAALLAATTLPTSVGVSVPVGPYVVGQLARLAGLGSTGTAIAIRAGAADADVSRGRGGDGRNGDWIGHQL